MGRKPKSQYAKDKEAVADSRERFYIGVTGLREFEDYSLFKAKIDKIIAEKRKEFKIVFVTGNRAGTDRMAAQYAKESKDIYVIKAPLYKDAKGKMQGEFARAQEIARLCNAVIVFTDPKIPIFCVKDVLQEAAKLGVITREIVVSVPYPSGWVDRPWSSEKGYLDSLGYEGPMPSYSCCRDCQHEYSCFSRLRGSTDAACCGDYKSIDE